MKRVIIIFSILLLGLGSCEFFGLTGDADDTADDTTITYDVKLEVTSPGLDVASIDWEIGKDDGVALDVPLAWTKEDKCEGDETLTIVAATSTTDTNSEITATIYVDGEEEATNTGHYDSDNEETAVLVSTTAR